MQLKGQLMLTTTVSARCGADGHSKPASSATAPERLTRAWRRKRFWATAADAPPVFWWPAGDPPSVPRPASDALRSCARRRRSSGGDRASEPPAHIDQVETKSTGSRPCRSSRTQLQIILPPASATTLAPAGGLHDRTAEPAGDKQRISETSSVLATLHQTALRFRPPRRRSSIRRCGYWEARRGRQSRRRRRRAEGKRLPSMPI